MLELGAFRVPVVQLEIEGFASLRAQGTCAKGLESK